MPTSLPTNIDTTYADDATDPSKKIHQQQHDIINASLNALSDPTAADTYTARASVASGIATHVAAPDPHGTRAYVDTQLGQYTPTASLPPVAVSGDALDVVGTTITFNYNTATSRYDYIGNVNRSSEAFQATGRTKIFVGPAAAPPENSTTAVGPAGTPVAITPVFRKYDEHRVRL